uniref:G-protein coupled receptors family 1 profile domain-containing protein n=1 Tax=Magallana gigas TaxID=29159 RepID=K1QMA3_MAGGI
MLPVDGDTTRVSVEIPVESRIHQAKPIDATKRTPNRSHTEKESGRPLSLQNGGKKRHLSKTTISLSLIAFMYVMSYIPTIAVESVNAIGSFEENQLSIPTRRLIVCLRLLTFAFQCTVGTIQLFAKLSVSSSGSLVRSEKVTIPEYGPQMDPPQYQVENLGIQCPVKVRVFRGHSQVLTSSRKKNVRTSRTTIMFSLAALMYVISYIPTLVVESINAVKPFNLKEMSTTLRQMIVVANSAYFFNLSFNPIVYGVFNKHFRDEVVLLFKGQSKNHYNK